MARDYGKGSDKVLTKSHSVGTVKGGGESTSGPTGSPRRYPKGGGCNARADWDPMRKPASTYAVNGI